MAAGDPGHDPADTEDARLTSLDQRLKAATEAEAIRTGRGRDNANKGYSQGNRVLAELIGGLVGGGLVGWVIDRFAGTTPWFLLGFLFLGIAVAFRNIIRISSERPE